MRGRTEEGARGGGGGGVEYLAIPPPPPPPPPPPRIEGETRGCDGERNVYVAMKDRMPCYDRAPSSFYCAAIKFP